jgi:O-methyltransferase
MRKPLVRRIGRLLRGSAEEWAQLRDLSPSLGEFRGPLRYYRAVQRWRALRYGQYTKLSCRRARALERLAASVERYGVPGALVDCGAWNGGSTVLLSNGAPSREAWAFDAFEAYPGPGALDGPDSADWSRKIIGSDRRVREAFERFAQPRRLHIVKGLFEDTFPQTASEIGEVAILHADSDWYESVMLTLQTFYPRVSAGGYVVIDDYGWWEGARRAVDEFRRVKNISAPLRWIDASGVYWSKP